MTGLKGRPAPFRTFFLLASLDAIVGAAVWLPVAFEFEGIPGAWAGAWHRNALLFGTIPAILAGFLLTALPRWTGRPAITSRTVRLLAGLWLLGRAASLFSLATGLFLAASFVLSLGLIAAKCVIASRDYRNFKVVLLLLCFCGSVILTTEAWQVEFAPRMGVASIISLISIIGGRVVPALTAAYRQSVGGEFTIRRSIQVERMAAAATAFALAAWVLIPNAGLTVLTCAAASCGHMLRLAQWRGWEARLPSSIIALHVGYLWIVVGFLLLAIHAFAPESVRGAAGIHAWTIGAVGTMGLAIMASMIRKHTGSPFSRSAAATAAFLSITLSCLSRLAAELPVANAALWTSLSAALWIASFGLFLAAFGRALLLRA